MQENPTNPFGAPAPWATAAPPPPPPQHGPATSGLLYELRPLSLGEILDRTFSLYRRHFWLFAGLSTIAAAVPTLSTLLQFVFAIPAFKPGAAAGADFNGRKLAVSFAIIFIGAILGLLAYSITQAATVKAVFAVYVGEETSISSALRSTLKHWIRYILITLWLGFSAIWLPLVFYMVFIASLIVPALRSPLVMVLFALLFLGSLVYAVIAYIRNSLGVVASTIEDLKVRKAMRRSKVLVAAHKARVFAIYLLAFALQIAASFFQGITGYIVGISHGVTRLLFEALSLLVTYSTTALVVPVAAIALCLFYIDERVRKEGFDLEILMGGDTPAATIANADPDALPSPFTSELA